MVITELHK